MAETYLYQKDVDQSLLMDGVTIPVALQGKLFHALGVTVTKGNKRPVNIFVEGKRYEASLRNTDFNLEKYPWNDIVQIRYSYTSPLAIKLQEIFALSAARISRQKERAEKASPVPDDQKESVRIYASDDGSIRFECFPASTLSMKLKFFQFVGPKDNLVKYPNSMKLVFLESLFSLIDASGKAPVHRVAERFKQFYANRLSQGKLPDTDVDQRIEHVDTCSNSDIYSVILDNPYQSISSAGFLRIKKIDDTEYFTVAPDLMSEMTQKDLQNLRDILAAKLDYYFTKIDKTYSGTNLNSLFNTLLNDYKDCRTRETFANNAMGTWVRQTVPAAIASLPMINPEVHIVKGSVGQGNWATVPWICIFDKRITSSAQRGVYIVYLLSESGDTLYLTLNQGCSDYKNTIGKRKTIQKMHEIAAAVQSQISPGSFSSGTNLTLGNEYYEQGCIFYKAYHKGAVPDHARLVEDLSELIEIYGKYVNLGKIRQYEKRAWLLTWNPDLWRWNIFDQLAALTKDGQTVEEKWSCANTHPAIGDTVYLMKIGSKPRGIIASGTVTHESFEDAHWDEAKRANGLTVNRIGVKFERILDYHTEPYLSQETLKEEFPLQQWSPQASGIEIRQEYMEKLSELWNQTIDSHTEIAEEPDPIDEYNISDELTRISEYIAAKGFSYEKGLIENFYLCLKAKPFVILAGTSGTGKTRLVKLFAEALGATTSNGRYKLLPVRPDWSDSTDLFGHVDLNGNYVPGALTDFIGEAIRHSDLPYFLCLDEMNLARVEYYMSDILSILETRRFKNGAIITDYIPESEAAVRAHGQLYLPENLYVIGTVNMDETTFPFSKKVLDRANTIEFSFVDLDIKPAIGRADLAVLDNRFLKSDYLLLAECGEGEDTILSTISILKRINDILKEANAQIGYRVRDEICFYVIYNEKYSLMSADRAIDYAILQKILPRIQGSNLCLKRTLVALFKICVGGSGEISPTASGSYSETMFQYLKSHDPVIYAKSAEKIAFMTRRFEEDGYTSYWI